MGQVGESQASRQALIAVFALRRARGVRKITRIFDVNRENCPLVMRLSIDKKGLYSFSPKNRDNNNFCSSSYIVAEATEEHLFAIIVLHRFCESGRDVNIRVREQANMDRSKELYPFEMIGKRELIFGNRTASVSTGFVNDWPSMQPSHVKHCIVPLALSP